jgi:hypothetical protein
MEDQSNDFSQNPNLTPFDKRIEDLGSPTAGCPETGDNSPFTSPPIIPSNMEFPSLGEYGGFPDLSSPGIGQHNNLTPNDLGNFGEGVGGGGEQRDFKREFDGSLGIGGQGMSGLGHGNGNGGGGQMGNNSIMHRPQLRQGSSSSFSMQIPRSVPEQFHQQLQRMSSNREGVDMGMSGVPNDLPFQ